MIASADFAALRRPSLPWFLPSPALAISGVPGGRPGRTASSCTDRTQVPAWMSPGCPVQWQTAAMAADLRVHEGGSGEPILVLLHGLGATGDVWEGWRPLLTGR